MQEENNHIDYLIARYLAGEASVSETEELNQWMAQSSSNRNYFDGIRFVDQQAVASHRIERVDVDHAWQKIHFKMKSTGEIAVSKEKVRKSAFTFWLRVAAVFVILMGTTIFLYTQHNSNSRKYEGFAEATTTRVKSCTLTDSSVITLNQNTRITCASNYGQKDRRIKLSGEAFFSVKHDQAKPFIVESNGTFIRVTGTSFNIRGEDSDSLVEVVVKTGKVLFFTESNQGIALVAGETGVFNKNKGTFIKITTTNQNTTAYANRVFVFYNTTLNEVFRQLNKVYGVAITSASEQIGQRTITVSFNDDQIGTILSILAETLGLKYSTAGEGQYVFEEQTDNQEIK